MAYNAENPTAGAAGGQDPYNYQRNLASQRASGQQQANFDALQRRFANNGGMNSGAAIQAESNANRGTQQDLENTQGQIGEQEAGQQAKFQMQHDQQNFAGSQAQQQRAQEQGQFESKMGEQKSEFGVQSGQKQQQLDQEAKQQNMDQQAMVFNEGLAQWQQGHSGGLLGAGGFLGTGI